MIRADLLAKISPSNPDTPFLFQVYDHFSLSGRGHAFSGQVVSGRAPVGDVLELVRAGKPGVSWSLGGVEVFGGSLDVAERGGEIALVLNGATRAEHAKGTLFTTPGTGWEADCAKAAFFDILGDPCQPFANPMKVTLGDLKATAQYEGDQLRFDTPVALAEGVILKTQGGFIKITGRG